MNTRGVHPVIAGLARTGHIREQSPCRWRYSGEDEDAWDTGCDNKHCFIVEGPHENGYHFCPYCGGELKVTRR